MLEVISGCMYSGKSEELIRRLRRCRIAGQKVWAFKPSVDVRYSATSISTHPVEGLGDFFEALPVTGLKDFLEHLREVSPEDVVGFDEVQFMSEEIIGVLEKLANLGVRVIVSGLDLDSEGAPFGPMGDLLARADSVTKLAAVCTAPIQGAGVCGKPATKSFRAPESSNGIQVQVGSLGIYEARCRSCWASGRDA